MEDKNKICNLRSCYDGSRERVGMRHCRPKRVKKYNTTGTRVILEPDVLTARIFFSGLCQGAEVVHTRPDAKRLGYFSQFSIRHVTKRTLSCLMGILFSLHVSKLFPTSSGLTLLNPCPRSDSRAAMGRMKWSLITTLLLTSRIQTSFRTSLVPLHMDSSTVYGMRPSCEKAKTNEASFS